MENAIFMMDYLNVTQTANNNFSHKGCLALDIAGQDAGIDTLKAPFTGTVKRIYQGNNAVWIESNNKVRYADGTIDYMTVLTMHDNSTSLKVGDVIKQGTPYYKEGTRGYATGNHIHLSVGKGKFTGSGWYQNSSGSWCINNQYDVYKALFLDNNTKIINGGGYNWIRAPKDTSTNNTLYIVKKGDNLTKISKQYGVSIDDIVRTNNIKNKNLIYVGQKLIIPNGTSNNYFKKYTGNTGSIVDALKSIGEKSEYSYRSMIASKNGITNYTGSATQNTKLLNLLKEGKLIRP